MDYDLEDPTNDFVSYTLNRPQNKRKYEISARKAMRTEEDRNLQIKFATGTMGDEYAFEGEEEKRRIIEQLDEIISDRITIANIYGQTNMKLNGGRTVSQAIKARIRRLLDPMYCIDDFDRELNNSYSNKQT